MPATVGPTIIRDTLDDAWAVVTYSPERPGCPFVEVWAPRHKRPLRRSMYLSAAKAAEGITYDFVARRNALAARAVSRHPIASAAPAA